MRVLVANPPAYLYDNTRHFIQAGSRWSFSLRIPKGRQVEHYLPYPFLLGYTSSLLKRDTEAEVKALDACALDFDEKDFINYVASFSPDLLIIEVPTVSFPLVMSVLESIKERVGCEIAVAGAHATALVNDVMSEYAFIDYVLLGEYEITARELVNVLIKGREVKDVKGLAYREGDRVIVNGRRELLKDLDVLPYPDRDDMPIYHYHDFEIVGKPCAQMLSSRGCPFSCIFCLERHVTYGLPLYRKRNPRKVVDEMVHCRDVHGARQVYFDDMTMVVDRSHIRAICQEILERGLDIPWACMGDVTLDRETLELMARSGCVGIKFGIESIHPTVLKTVSKGFVNIERVKKFVKTCKELGIWTHATYMIGLPNDTKEKILATFKFALQLNTDSAQFSIATPFPGTPFFRLAEEKGWLISLDWTLYDGANYSVISYPHLSKEEIEDLYHLLIKLWHIRKEGKSLANYYLRHPFEALTILKKVGLRRSLRLLKYALSII